MKLYLDTVHQSSQTSRSNVRHSAPSPRLDSLPTSGPEAQSLSLVLLSSPRAASHGFLSAARNSFRPALLAHLIFPASDLLTPDLSHGELPLF